MKLVLFLFLFSSYLFDDLKKSSLGYLSKKNHKRTYINGQFIYLDRNDFYDNKEIDLNITIYEGKLVEDFLFCKESLVSPDYEIYQNFTNAKKYTYYSTSSGCYYNNIFGIYYNYNSYFFKIKKPIEKYLFISFPTFTKASNGSAIIQYTKNSEISEILNTGVIIGFSFASLFLLAIILIIIITLFKKRKDDKNGLTYISLPQEFYSPKEPIIIN